MYFHLKKDWPKFTWDSELIMRYVSQVRLAQGRILGQMEQMGFDLRDEALLDNLTVDIVKSSEIEGEQLNSEEVRSSVARSLGLEHSGLPKSSREVDGLVDMMMDATQNHKEAMTKERLWAWHAALFPTSYSGMYKIEVGAWRTDHQGPMQVVSGPMGKERVHYEAPEAARLDEEMQAFIHWFNTDEDIEPVIKSALAHLWFVSIHPFDDGNGRIARALAESLLARADQSPQRFYSISAQIMASRKDYYLILENTQKGSLEISQWLVWYFERVMSALEATQISLAKIKQKARFWEQHRQQVFNARQVMMINKLLGPFQGKLRSSKWAKMCKVHRDTARRDILDLLEKKVLKASDKGGRSQHYQLILPDA